MENLEKQPNPKDTQAQLSQTREQFKEERDIKAEERNGYRTIWQKIWGLEETSGMDIAVEEALRMDAEIETLMRQRKVATTAEAVVVIEKEGKFGLKGEERIGKEEWARFRTLQFGGALKENDFGKASEIVYRAQQEKVDDETRQILEETIAPLITQKVAELVKAKDGRNFVRAFYEFGRLQPITAEGLSQEGLRSPEIQDAIKENIISWMRTDPEYFTKYLDKWAQAGIIDAKALSNLPEIQQIAEERLIDWMNTDPEYFAMYRDKWAQAGIIDAKALSNLPEIQQIAKERLIGWMNTDPEYFAMYRDKWAQAGIIDAKALSNLPEIQKIAKEKLLSWMRTDQRYFAIYRDKWAGLGIINAEKINGWINSAP